MNGSSEAAQLQPGEASGMVEGLGSRRETARVSLWHQTPWRWLYSLRVGITLLTLLVIASIAGTLIDPLERAQKVVYYSWWYKALLLGLATNLSVTTWRTITIKVLPLRKHRVQRERVFFTASKASTSLPYEGDPEEVAKAFKRSGFRVTRDGNAGAATTGWLGYWGAPVSHFGLILVLVCGFVTSWVAVEGVIQLYEGQHTNSMMSRAEGNEQIPLGFTIQLDDFDTDYFPRTRIPSHFTSTVTVEDGGGMLYSGPVEVNHSPKIHGWALHQTSYQEEPRLNRYLLVVTNKGTGEKAEMEVSVGQVRSVPGNPGYSLALRDGFQWLVLEGDRPVAGGEIAGAVPDVKDLHIVARGFVPDFVIGPDRQVGTRSEELNNPAVQIALHDHSGFSKTTWLFLRDDMKAMMHQDTGPVNLEFIGVNGDGANRTFRVAVTAGANNVSLGVYTLSLGQDTTIQTTEDITPMPVESTGDWEVALLETRKGHRSVLSLTKNPVIPFIYSGCGIMILGLCLAFFVRRRDVWFLVEPKRRMLHVAARYRHPRDDFDPAVEKALRRIPGLKYEPESTE